MKKMIYTNMVSAKNGTSIFQVKKAQLLIAEFTFSIKRVNNTGTSYRNVACFSFRIKGENPRLFNNRVAHYYKAIKHSYLLKIGKFYR